MKIDVIIPSRRDRALLENAIEALSTYKFTKGRNVRVMSRDEFMETENSKDKEFVYGPVLKGTHAIVMDVGDKKQNYDVNKYRDSFSDFEDGWDKAKAFFTHK